MSEDIDFPLIYCNGDSYSDETYHPALTGKTYADWVAKTCNGFVINKAISGSCNRRIIRTSVHDLLHQRQLNPTQKIIALIGLSFELRSEIWNDNVKNVNRPEESNFVKHQFSKQTDWRENLLQGNDIEPQNHSKLDDRFFRMWSEARAYFYSPYAERINLLTDLIMFRSLLTEINVQFIIFQSPKAEPLQSDYLLDFLKSQIVDDARFIDFEQFGFCNWCYEQKFIPFDYKDRPTIAHYGPDAHCAFAEQLLVPKLKDLGIL
jgi:hypothetical protein